MDRFSPDVIMGYDPGRHGPLQSASHVRYSIHIVGDRGDDFAENPGALGDRDDDAVRENRGALQSGSGSEVREVSFGEDARSRAKDGDGAVGPPNFPDGEGKDFFEMAASRRKYWSGRPDLNRGPPAPKVNSGSVSSCLVYVFRASCITVKGGFRQLLFRNCSQAFGVNP